MLSVTTSLSSVLTLTEGHALAITSEQLAKFWDYVDHKYYNQDSGMWDNDAMYGICTFLNSSPALALRKAGHSVRVVGCPEEDLGTAFYEKYGYQGGHDWLLVDERWIIDQWAVAYLGAEKSIHDLKDPTTFELYPPRDKWTDLTASYSDTYEDWFERAARDWVASQCQKDA